VSFARRVCVGTFLLALAACGKPLGTYEVRDIRLVSGSVFKIVEPGVEVEPQMLRIEFTSKTDMYNAAGDAQLYVFASFCPFQDKSPVYVSRPYFNDRPTYDLTTQKVMRPVKDASGRYVYTTYMSLNGNESVNRNDGRLEFTGYDLRRQPVDLCVRIEHPGYFITPSRSRVFVLPAAMIRRALSA
jgi:hypothetical protein